MLTKLIVKNFKSIGEKGIDLELKPLTILVGPNGTGKTTVLEAIAFIAQGAKSEQKLSGKFVSFPSATEIAHKGELERWISWEMHFSNENLFGFIRQFRPDTGESNETILADGNPVLTMRLVGDRRQGYTKFLEEPSSQNKSSAHGASYHPLLYAGGYRDPEWPEKREECEKAEKITERISEMLNTRVFLISALRGEVRPEVEATQEATWVGIKAEGLLPLLHISESPKYEDIRKKIDEWAKMFGIGGLWAGRTDPGKIGAVFKDAELKATLNLAYAGSGSRQIISVIFQLFWAKNGSLVMIEEPEISLHPEAQVKLGELFADAIKEDKQILVSTHSHFLLLALGQAVQKGLKVDDIAVYHVTKDKDGTKAASVKLSKRGYPLGWPPSYQKVEKELAFNWAKGLAE